MNIHHYDYEEEARVPGPMVTMTFDMGDESQLYTYNMMMQAHQLHAALEEFGQKLRTMDKYNQHPSGKRELTEEERTLISEVRESFWETVNESGADIL